MLLALKSQPLSTEDSRTGVAKSLRFPAQQPAPYVPHLTVTNEPAHDVVHKFVAVNTSAKTQPESDSGCGHIGLETLKSRWAAAREAAAHTPKNNGCRGCK